MPTIYSIHEAPERLSAESLAKGAPLLAASAEGLSRAWVALARALAEQMDPRGEDLQSLPMRETALALFSKALGKLETRGSNSDRDREEAPKLFASSQDAAERAARAMGFSADGIDQLWELAFNLALCDRDSLWAQTSWSRAVGEQNKNLRFSEALCWSSAERVAKEALKRVCSDEMGPTRLTSAADACLDALGEVWAVTRTGDDPGRARAWMGAREARAAKAMLEIVALTAAAGADPSSSGKSFAAAGAAFEGKADSLSRLISASEEAALKRGQGASNVKQRRIGQG